MGGVLPVNLRVEDIAVRVEDDGEALEDVDKDFVLFVLAALPRQGNRLVHRTGGRRLSARHGQLGLRPGRLDSDGLVEDILLENFRGRLLRVAVVEHLVEQFIDEDEVLSDRFLRQETAIVLHADGEKGEAKTGGNMCRPRNNASCSSKGIT